ncbi:Uu.00g004930.m01.CDS01 [Anthostomella pinea]|uniref:Uu.00g004930.m01.CDS01 n=1 Tax=Anthostomella pinea TaxID=933095 RepID=A0AAI8YIZ5_9PEZI|nr:Uu.00g004930.m01.CDS01 [Anthostomella pinea]
MACIGISYGGRAFFVEKPTSWQDLLQTASIKFGLSINEVKDFRAFYCMDMSGTLPRWDLDHTAWAGVRANSCIYFESAIDSSWSASVVSPTSVSEKRMARRSEP